MYCTYTVLYCALALYSSLQCDHARVRVYLVSIYRFSKRALCALSELYSYIYIASIEHVLLIAKLWQLSFRSSARSQFSWSSKWPVTTTTMTWLLAFIKLLHQVLNPPKSECQCRGRASDLVSINCTSGKLYHSTLNTIYIDTDATGYGSV